MRPLKSRSIRFPCGMPLCKRRMMQKSQGESGINTRLLIRVTNSEACITTSQCTGMSCLKLAEFLRTRRCSQDFDCPTSTGRDSVRMEHELTHAEQLGLHLKTREERWAVMNTWKILTVPQPLSRILRFRRTYLICIVRNSSSYSIAFASIPLCERCRAIAGIHCTSQMSCHEEPPPPVASDHTVCKASSACVI